MRIELPARGLHLDYELNGPADAPVLVLIMGLGMQRVAWPPELLTGLQKRGLRVLTFDNRDIGESGSGAISAGMPVARAFMRYLLHRPVPAPYTLIDMAQDTLALCDALGITRFHVAGISMGGMIAQELCLIAPDRVCSLVSMSSSAGPRAAPFPEVRVLHRLLGAPGTRSSHEQRLDHFLALFTALGQHHEAAEIERLRLGLDRALRRAYRPQGTLRQLLAIVSDPDRRTRLRALRTPTLILHGAADPLVPVAAAQRLAAAIPGATLKVIDRLGHDLPAWWVPQLVEELAGWAVER